jgi:hypothetical protein
LIGRLNQPAADGFLPLRVFKPSSSDSADRGHSIVQVMYIASVLSDNTNTENDCARAFAYLENKYTFIFIIMI